MPEPKTDESADLTGMIRRRLGQAREATLFGGFSLTAEFHPNYTFETEVIRGTDRGTHLASAPPCSCPNGG